MTFSPHPQEPAVPSHPPSCTCVGVNELQRKWGTLAQVYLLLVPIKTLQGDLVSPEET